ncbi:hypothetical protein [Gilvibacter sp.]|uniref:hypothetical protein n=1 Tax=Gilvibacter sp. TaxID=2729997 RepID=UPI0025BA3C3B|nr:hypothetical protein [Gilvibacter sp.]NQX78796.1 hypothetical protein [Gilvibacter sp.]
MLNLGPIEDLKQKVISLEQLVNSALRDVFNQNEKLLIEIQTQIQLYQKGQTSKAITIVPSYAQSTIGKKKRKGDPFDRVTLKDTGALYSSVRFEALDDRLIVTTNVSYTKYLTAKYGPDIFGIQNLEMENFLEKYYLPFYSESAKNLLFK